MPPECGYDTSISYDKGCYPGQEILARIRTYGHVNWLLRRVRLEGSSVPRPADPILIAEEKQGHITSASLSPGTGKPVALGYVRHKKAEAKLSTSTRSRISGYDRLAESGASSSM